MNHQYLKLQITNILISRLYAELLIPEVHIRFTSGVINSDGVVLCLPGVSPLSMVETHADFLETLAISVFSYLLTI